MSYHIRVRAGASDNLIGQSPNLRCGGSFMHTKIAGFLNKVFVLKI